MTAGQRAALACLLEATARKPGNVHPEAAFADLAFIELAASAVAIVSAFDRAATQGIGPTVLEAIGATRRVVATNSNLGMVLLLAPLAMLPEDAAEDDAARIGAILDAATAEDVADCYRAIRLARPGGLGEAAEQDIRTVPTASLRAVMRLAADRDLVARQYANDYAEVRSIALPALRSALEADRSLEGAIVEMALHLMARLGDSLVARKRGLLVATELQQRAADVLAAGWPDSPSGRLALDRFDGWLRADGHARNPGAVADLCCAGLFLALRDGTIPLPLRGWAAGRFDPDARPPAP